MKVSIGVGLMMWLLATPARAAGFYVTVAGHVGEADYEQRFTTPAKDLDKVLKATGTDAHVFSLIGGDATRVRLTQVLEQVAREARPDDDFVLTLIGHGSYDGVEYKFNLVGPDMSAGELAALCNRIAARRQLIVNATSSSGGSIAAFQRPGRAIVTSTKSGTEKNATVFVRYWVEALRDPSADVDKNESVTALEAFQYADRKTAEFYTAQQRLATEHAVFEDTGKGEPVRTPSVNSGEGRLLASLNITPQKPLRRAYERDPAAVALWEKESYPALRKRAKRLGAKIFFSDEAGFQSDPVLGRTYGLKGKTPVVITSGQRQSLNVISAVNARGEFWAVTYSGKLNAESFVAFLRDFMNTQSGKIFLVVDGHPAHKANLVKSYIQSLKGRLELHFLPPYAPDLNPDEFVWSYMKNNGVSKKPLKKNESLQSRINQDLNSIKENRKLVQSFFHAASVLYVKD